MKKWLGILLLALALAGGLSGCGYPELYERILIHGIGVDLCEEGYRVTVRSSSSVEDEGEELFVCQGKTVLDALSSLSLSTGREPFYSHNYLVVFGEDCARQGLDKCLDFFVRYYNTRPAVSVFLARGTAEEALSVEKDGKLLKMSQLEALGSGGRYNGQSAHVELLDFVNGALREGGASVLPVLAVTEEGARIVGTAYFEEYRLKGALDLDASRGYLAAVDQLEQGELVVSGPELGTVTLSLKKSSGQVRLEDLDPVPAFRVRVEVEADVSAKSGGADGDGFYPALEEAAGALLREQIQSAIRQAVVEDGCDIFGFGNRLFRQRAGYWREHGAQWNELVRAGRYEVQVDVTVRRLEEETLNGISDFISLNAQ